MKPIIFNTEMVRSILDGRKTVTRRVIKPQPEMILAYCFAGSIRKQLKKWCYPDKNAWKYWGDKYKHNKELSTEEKSKMWTPPYHTDDILYVRETWAINRITPHDPDYVYKNDYNCSIKPYSNWKWKPSIHMPKEAARIFLHVTNVRVERLQDIQERGECSAQQEGFINDINLNFGTGKSAKRHFSDLWDSTIKKSDLDRYGWNANPWVWVIEFERVNKPTK